MAKRQQFPVAAASPTPCSPSPARTMPTQIIIGKADRSRWFELLHSSVVRDLLRRSGPISMHVVTGDAISRLCHPGSCRTGILNDFDDAPPWRRVPAIEREAGGRLTGWKF